jgi:transketolase
MECHGDRRGPLAKVYNRPDMRSSTILYAIVTDGDLMEGVASELLR